jgi:hypothetical protein
MNDYDRKFQYRISWNDGIAVLQRRNYYDRSVWQTLHVATEDDRAAMVDGVIGYDPETKPSTLAMARHVANGGD